MIQIGPYRITLLEAGDFKLDGGAMFGVVPKSLWSKTNPSDELNRINMTARCLLIQSRDRKILVDVGIGHKESEKFNKIFAVDYSRRTLEKSLAEQDVDPADVTDVVYTHLHFDHAGGSTRIDAGSTVPMFKNAQHYVQKRQYEHALARSERDQASYLDHNYEPVQRNGQLRLIEGNAELIPGIHALTTSGHTPDLQTVLITDGQTSLWYPTDLLPLASQIPLPYIMGYDLQPLITLEDKRRFLSRACDENWIVVYEHDPCCAAATLARDDQGRIVKGEDVAV
jgi:glyoxylase-like metal-dependent hydrolase (beta-lactamase superfamily II)